MDIRQAESIPTEIPRQAPTQRLGAQTLWYFLSQSANAGLGLLATVVLTRSLSMEDFGAYTFAYSFILLTAVFFDFGLSSATMRLAAITEHTDAVGSLMAAVLKFAVRNGVLFALFLLVCSVVVPFASGAFLTHPLPQGMAMILIIAAPAAVALPLFEPAVSALQGRNAMTELSISLPLPKVFFLVLFMAFLAAGMNTATIAVLTTLFGVFIAVTIMWVRLGPDFSDSARGGEQVRDEVRHFGREIYMGRIVDGLTNGLDKILVAMFQGVVSGGIYSVASLMSMPIGMFSRSLAASAYRRFSTLDRIPRALLWANSLWCVFGTVALILACEIAIPYFFPLKYGDALGVLPILAAGAALAGLNHPFHAFLAARRQGRPVKVMSVTTSSINVAANFALIPFLGMHGAGIALVMSYGLNILMNLHYYRDWCKKVPTSNH